MALWVANVVGALSFAASQLSGVMILAGVASPTALPPVELAEVILLNGLVGVIASEAYIRNGLVPASGVHFRCDVVGHVVHGAVK